MKMINTSNISIHFNKLRGCSGSGHKCYVTLPIMYFLKICSALIVMIVKMKALRNSLPGVFLSDKRFSDFD